MLLRQFLFLCLLIGAAGCRTNEWEGALPKKERAEAITKIKSRMLPEYTFEVGDTPVAGRDLKSISGMLKSGAKSGGPGIAQVTSQNVTLPPLGGSTVNSVKEKSTSNDRIPEHFDWAKLKRVSPVKKQMAQDCWAFATIAVAESSLMIKQNSTKAVDLSEQSVIDCNLYGFTAAHGGGWTFGITMDQGIPEEKAYEPYVGKDGQCRVRRDVPRYFAEKWSYIDYQHMSRPDPQLIKRAILNHGPVFCAMQIDDFAACMVGGVFNKLAETNSVWHAVVITGWDDRIQAWRIKNSWGKSWNKKDKGFAWIKYGVCNIGFGAAWCEMLPKPSTQEPIRPL